MSATKQPSLNRPRVRACPHDAIAVASVVLLLASFAYGQEWEFEFDPNGNLQTQTPANLAAPHLLAQPQSQVVAPGALGSFFAVAANSHGLSYQWQFNGTDISGATNDTLLLQNVGATNEGQYSVVLSNSSGSVTSAPAALLLDGDRDGLADSWELASFGNLNQYPTGDADGDGVSNRDEFLDGTNPADNASARFRLTVLSNGGLVDVTPSRLSYTNGEVVTLTATAFAPNTFRGWTGDTNTTSNPLTLVMTTNKTVFAHQASENLVWNAGNGDWHVASNWEPNFVPTTNDNVFITRAVTVTVNSPAECGSLTFGGSGTPTLTGTGTLTVHRDSLWTSGHMIGSGRTVINPGATLNLANALGVNLTTRALENGGTFLWTGAGTINLGAAAVITNRPGALFEIRGAGGTAFGGGANSRFDNAGTFRKSVLPGTTTLNNLMAFNNYGTVQVQIGALLLGGGGTHTGAFEVSAGTTLILAGGTHTGGAASSITGAGNLTVISGTVTLAGLVNVSGLNFFDGGTANLNGNYICTNNTLTIAGGIANINGSGTVTPTVLNFSSGTLGGSAVVTVLSQITWTGGTMTGTGRTIISSGLTLNLANSVILSGGRTLENRGSILWTSADFNFGSGSILTNGAGALFEAQGAGGFGHIGGPNGRFDNAGTFRKSISAGTTAVNGLVSFNNYGSVEIQTGTLFLDGGGTHTGTFTVPAGTTLNLAGGIHNASAASSITGAGNFTVDGGTATLAGLVNVTGNNLFDSGTANLNGNYICTNNTLTIAGGTANFNGSGTVTPTVLNLSSGTLGGSQVVTVLSQMNWTGGTMIGSGRTIIPVGVVLNVASAGGVILNTRTLENGGTVLWTAGNINTTGCIFTNRAGALVEATGAVGFGHIGGANARFDNAGTFRKSVNATALRVNSGVIFNNFNRVEIQNGFLDLAGGGRNEGTIEMTLGTALNFMGGTFTDTPSSSITGAADLLVTGGTVNLSGLVNVTFNHYVSGGTANFTGQYYCTNNTLTISGGTANFNGNGTVTPAVLSLSGGILSGSQVVTAVGVMNWTGGTMSGNGRTIISAGATLNLAHAVGVNLTTRTLENGGTVIWTSGYISMSLAVITNRAGALFENRGLGALSFNGGLSRFDNAGTFRKSVNTGTMPVTVNISFNNYGTVEIQSGILAPSGGYFSTANSRLHSAIGGTVVGTGYGRLQVGGTVNLNGALSVSFTNGYSAASNDVFTLVTAGTRNGAFTSFAYPSNAVTMQLSNTPNSVVVRVTEVFLEISGPVLRPPEISGSDVRLIWTAVSNAAYRVEFQYDLGSTNWDALPGDVTTTSNTATKLDALTTSNRFYRVRVLP